MKLYLAVDFHCSLSLLTHSVTSIVLTVFHHVLLRACVVCACEYTANIETVTLTSAMFLCPTLGDGQTRQEEDVYLVAVLAPDCLRVALLHDGKRVTKSAARAVCVFRPASRRRLPRARRHAA